MLKSTDDLRSDAYTEAVRVMLDDAHRLRWIPIDVEDEGFVLEAVESRPRPTKLLVTA